ncbi:unnamed protein product [Lathyrus oleraceus]|uniref:Cysteine-rich receptor-kinase-like protein n=1 Tax=Pisum sativum TaxID=3888 RepID=A0A9D5GXA0_PEA|nr:cysteine-rich receptor-like protein kinase 6 [Pisum sativum]KAI5444736.1 hypothetical protein KIW84_013128 [Pisum sativum]
MANTHNILLIFTFIIFLTTFTSTNSWDDPFFLNQYCSSNSTLANTSFQINLTTLLSSLSSIATTKTNTKFYNTTFNGNNPSDTIYGMYLCRDDVPSQLCQQCIVNATQRLTSECSLSKEGIVWYNECMVWYSTAFIFSTVARTAPSFNLFNTDKVPNTKSFMSLLFSTMNKTANEAAFGNSVKKFATNEITISKFQTLYCLVQCTPNLSPHDCRICLSGLIEDLPGCCEDRVGGRVLNPSCNIRYEFYPFYIKNIGSPNPSSQQILLPQTKNSDAADSIVSGDPFYLSHNCSSNKTFTVNSTFKVHLTTLFSYLSSNATKSLFYKAHVENTTFGLFMCRGDVPFSLCEICVKNATQRMTKDCNFFQEGVIWYSQCMIRYSNWNFFSLVDKTHVYYELNVTSDSSPNKERNLFNFVISTTLSNVAIVAGDSDAKFGTKSLELNDLQTLYTLGQCTHDLSSDDCKGCLGDIIGNGIPWPYLGSVGGRVLYPSCNLRFELFQFYRDNDNVTKPKLTNSSSEKRTNRPRTITLIVLFSVLPVILFFVGFYLIKRKAKRSFRSILNENFGDESATLEPLQYGLDVIEAATNNFANENFIGKGGFGEVYKGTLLDGRQIAVKRLSKSSTQGGKEFKNEVLLIAKLQHRNLVTFIGFCLEEQEKILIYEYVPNKGLDHFLFDVQQPKFLSWPERYNIIRGIAQGIIYLHVHSRLKVIHRDLKPSNILLDENMIPKISDFGLARIFELNQDEASTNRIVGTLGYMSPEYAMLGQFSEKSDVYSFGVMVLEIMTGKKNVRSYESIVGDSLLSYVWRQWRDETPFNILDPKMKGTYSETEVTKCIQIGLLCAQQFPDARPTIATVVSYLNNDFIELPNPQEPTFLFHGQMDAKGIPQESSSTQSISTSTALTANELSITELLPR